MANLLYHETTNKKVPGNLTHPHLVNCHQDENSKAIPIFTLGSMGMGANVCLILLILSKRALRR